jgi:hypothetical protein
MDGLNMNAKELGGFRLLAPSQNIGFYMLS